MPFSGRASSVDKVIGTAVLCRSIRNNARANVLWLYIDHHKTKVMDGGHVGANLAGEVAMVTGGCRGIGAAIAADRERDPRTRTPVADRSSRTCGPATLALAGSLARRSARPDRVGHGARAGSELARNMAALTILGRIGTTADIAAAVAFLDRTRSRLHHRHQPDRRWRASDAVTQRCHTTNSWREWS
jgi:hypothetical protein